MAKKGAYGAITAASRAVGGGGAPLAYSAPTYFDADWGQRSTLTHAVTFPDGGATMLLSDESGGNYAQAEQGYTGITRYETVQTHGTKSLTSGTLMDCLISHWTDNYYRILVTWNDLGVGSANEIRLVYIDDGTLYSKLLGSTSYDMKDVTIIFDVVDGTDLDYDITITDTNDDTQNFTGTYAGAYFPAVTYYPYYNSYYQTLSVSSTQLNGVTA